MTELEKTTKGWVIKDDNYYPDYDDSYLDAMEDDLNRDITRMMEARAQSQGEAIMAREAELGRKHHNDVERMKNARRAAEPTSILDDQKPGRDPYTIVTHGGGAIVSAYGVAMIPEIEFETPESGIFDIKAELQVVTDWDGGFIDLMQHDSSLFANLVTRSTIRFVAFHGPETVRFNYRVQSAPGSKQRWTLHGDPKIGVVGVIKLEAVYVE